MVLFIIFHHYLGQNYLGQIRCQQQSNRRHTRRIDQHPAHFHGDALRTDHGDLLGHFANCVLCLFLQYEIEGGRKTHRPKHAELIFCNSFARIADGTDNSLCKVLLTAYEVDYPFFNRIVKQSVDSEISPRRVFFWRAESNMIWMPSVAIRGIFPKCSHLDHARRFRAEDGYHSESSPDGQEFARRPKSSRICGGVALVATS